MTKGKTWFICLVLFPVLIGIHREIGLIAGSILVLALSLILERDKLWVWLVALAISWTWISINHHNYAGYNNVSIQVMGVSLLPILAWPALMMLCYFSVFPLFRAQRGWRLWVLLFAANSAMIIGIEYVGYHWLDIHLKAGYTYGGWPLLDVFHCPVWMQICYFFNCALFCAILSLAHRPGLPRES